MKDFFGKSISEGDIVIRPKFKSFALHKINRITKKRIYLSVRREMTDCGVGIPNYLIMIDAVKKEDLNSHNSEMYIKKDWSKFNLIKLEKK